MPFYDLFHTVNLARPMPWRGLTDSALLHVALAGLLYAGALWPQPRVHLVDLHTYRVMGRYQLSPYLPELHGAPTLHKDAGKADPVLAQQEIRSVPDEPDNPHQTIETPSKLKLPHDVDVPNLVAYEPPPAPPLDASSRSAILQAPAALPEAAKRAPEIVQLQPQRALPKAHAAQPAPEVGAVGGANPPKLTELLPPAANPALPVRAPEIVQLKPQRAPSLMQPHAAQAAPDAGAVNGGSAPKLAELLPPAANPALPGRGAQIVQLNPQRVPSSSQPPVAQPAPALAGVSSGSGTNLAQLLPQRANAPLLAPNVTHTPDVVALSVHPADTLAAIPEGNRRGAFAASPAGHPNATGAPGAGDGSGAGVHDSTGPVNAPPGISVGAPPGPAAPVAGPNAGSGNAVAPESDVRKRLLAAARPPVIASIPPHAPVAHETTAKPTELENHVFAGRRSYTLVVNMPNLNVRVGSWIIRYVDREQGLAAVPITAPEVLRKSDPAFPGELTDVHGVVILTATIRADGTVSDVAVAQGLFPALDQNAAEALSHWLFRPALKNGQPIDLEAVITVPFRTK